MHTIVRCVSCGADSTEIECDIRAEIKLSRSYRSCDECGNWKTDEEHLWFCSPQCLNQHVISGELKRNIGLMQDRGTIVDQLSLWPYDRLCPKTRIQKTQAKFYTTTENREPGITINANGPEGKIQILDNGEVIDEQG